MKKQSVGKFNSLVCINSNIHIASILLAALIILPDIVLNAQVLRDTARIREVRECIGDIYNGRFEKAEEICSDFEKSFPDSPVPSLIRGMITYWRNYPLLPSSKARPLYEKQLQRSIAISERKSPRGDEAEYLLADMCARGLLLVFYSDNDLSGEVFSLATSSYHYLRESFKYTTVYPDFYFFTGLYNYYREKYPEIHPIYRPLAILFPRGDAEKGVRELQTAFRESIVLNAEAGSFLSWISCGYEFDNKSSIAYSREICDRYPDNLYFKGNYIKFLLLEKMYDEAEAILARSDSGIKSNTYFRGQVMVFNGILQEKKYKDNVAAIKFYEEGLKELAAFSDYGGEFRAYAYFGLSRIAEPGKSGDKRKKYRREANKLVEFSHMTYDN
jgi:hypothetical protein